MIIFHSSSRPSLYYPKTSRTLLTWLELCVLSKTRILFIPMKIAIVFINITGACLVHK